MWLFCCYSFERSYKVLKWKTSCILLNRKMNFALIKTNRNQNWEIPYTELERWKLCFRSYKNHRLKLWGVGSRERKKKVYFVPVIFPEGIFFDISVLSQCMVYWMHFQNLHTLHIRKHYFLPLFAYF